MVTVSKTSSLDYLNENKQNVIAIGKTLYPGTSNLNYLNENQQNVRTTGNPIYIGGSSFGGYVSQPSQPSEVEINKELAAASSAVGRSLSATEVKAIQEAAKKKQLYGAKIETGNVNFGNIKVNYPTEGRNLPNQRSTIQNISPTKSYREFLMEGTYNPSTKTLTMTSTAGLGGNKTIYEVDRSKYVSGVNAPLVYKAEVVVNENGQVRPATPAEKNAFYNEKDKAKEKARKEYEKNVSFLENPAAATRGAFTKGGTAYFGAVSNVVTGAAGQPQLSKERKEQGGELIGTAGLWAMFSPVMKTGSYGEAFQELNPVKKKTQQQVLLGENKFSELGTGLREIEDKTYSITQEIASKNTLQEQLQILKSIRSKLTTKEAIENFKAYSKRLVDEGVIKPVVVDITKQGITTTVPKAVTKTEFIYMIENAPKMKGIGFITGFTTADYNSAFEKKSEIKKAIVPKGNSFVKIMLGAGVTTVPKEKTKEKVSVNSFAGYILGTPQLQLPKPVQKTAQQTKTIQKTAQDYLTPRQPQPEYKYPKPLYPFLWFKPPKKAYSWGYKTYSGKTKPSIKKYQPSLSAWQLGISAPKKFNLKQQWRGVELRPILYKKESEIPKDYMEKLNMALLGKKKSKGGKHGRNSKKRRR